MVASKPYRRVLVPVDGSAASTAAVRESMRTVGEAGCLRLVHALDEMAQARIAIPGAGGASENVLRAPEREARFESNADGQ